MFALLPVGVVVVVAAVAVGVVAERRDDRPPVQLQPPLQPLPPRGDDVPMFRQVTCQMLLVVYHCR